MCVVLLKYILVLILWKFPIFKNYNFQIHIMNNTIVMSVKEIWTMINEGYAGKRREILLIYDAVFNSGLLYKI